MNKQLSKFIHKNILSIYILLLFLWFLNFVTTNLVSPFIAKFVEIIQLLICFTYIVKLKYIKKYYFVSLIILLNFIFLIILKYLFDYKISYTSLVYFKTVYYLIFSILMSITYSSMFINSDIGIRKRIIQTIVTYCVLTTLALFIYLRVRYSWEPGKALYYYDVGKYYQGMSRASGLLFLIILLCKKYVMKIFWLVTLIINLLLIVSFNGGGALFAIFIGLTFYLLNYRVKVTEFLTLVASFIWFYLFISNSDSFDLFTNRMNNKLSSDEDTFTRSWLVEKGIELWWNDTNNFIFGSGIVHYSCYIDNCLTYWHPHNFFVLLITWFGLFSLPLILLIVILTICIFIRTITTKDLSHVTIYAVYLYYFLLSMVGGDIEQNRHFIFLIFFCYFITKNEITFSPKRFKLWRK